MLNKQRRRTTHLEILGKYFIWQADIPVDLGSCFLGSSLFSPESSLARSTNAWMSLSVMESEAFYIRSVAGDGFPIFISLCEPLPKMSNPLQACL